jgi:tetratricopeptide (TPR) repeat protein
VKQAVSSTSEQARRMGAPRAIALCQCFNGALEFQTGRWAEADTALRESIQLYREIGAASGEALACQRLGVLQTARGQLAEGLATLEEGVLAAERALMRAHCLTRLFAAIARNRLAADDVMAASQVLAQGLATSERHGHCTTCDALLLPVAVSVRVAEGDFGSAEDFCRRLDEAARQYASRLWLAMARQSRGELAAAQGRLDAALDDYAKAQAGFSAAGNEFEVARCLAAITALRFARGAPGDIAAGQETERESHRILERLGGQVGKFMQK